MWCSVPPQPGVASVAAVATEGTLNLELEGFVNAAFDAAWGRLTLITIVAGASGVVGKPIRAVGGFFAMTADIFVLMFTSPFVWREFGMRGRCPMWRTEN
jgi:hypothetical protein